MLVLIKVNESRHAQKAFGSPISTASSNAVVFASPTIWVRLSLALRDH